MLPIDVIFETDATGPVPVAQARGEDQVNGLSSWTVSIAVPHELELEALVRAPATLRFRDGAEETERAIPLVVMEIELTGGARGVHGYALTLGPPHGVLALRRGYRVWVGKTTQEIVTEVMGAVVRLKWRLTERYAPRPQCVQYDEDDWSFVERILADEGIAYWSDADEAGPLLVFGDDKGAHDGLQDGALLLLRSERGLVAPRSFWSLEIRDEMASAATHVRDFDVRNPGVFLEGRAGEGALEVFEYPARVADEKGAATRAKTRLEQLRRNARQAFGTCDCMRVQAGRLVDIEGCAEGEGDGRWLVVHAEYEYREDRVFIADVRMVPATSTWRPAVPRSAPRIDGLESAMTTGPAGEEIHVDDLGRVKIRMPWDRSGIGDQRSSHWVRCLQMGMGGSMVLPRVGWEVAVGYQHGDPDVPVVLGRIYNGSAVVPYGLPGGAARTTLQSASSPGGAGTHEIRFDDSAGKQEVFVHATKDQTIQVGNDARRRVKGNDTLDIGLSHAVGVTKAHAHSVVVAQKIDVKTAHQLVVKGERDEKIGAMELVNVGANRNLETKPYTEVVGAMYGLECNQSNTHVTGAFTQAIGGSLVQAAKNGTSDHVALARSETVAASRVIVTDGYEEEVRGLKSVGAGAATDKAGGKVVTVTHASGQVEAGSWKIDASGAVVIGAPSITIDVSGSLTAGAMKMDGGKIKATKGTTHIKATTIKRQGETKIE